MNKDLNGVEGGTFGYQRAEGSQEGAGKSRGTEAATWGASEKQQACSLVDREDTESETH